MGLDLTVQWGPVICSVKTASVVKHDTLGLTEILFPGERGTFFSLSWRAVSGTDHPCVTSPAPSRHLPFHRRASQLCAQPKRCETQGCPNPPVLFPRGAVTCRVQKCPSSTLNPCALAHPSVSANFAEDLGVGLWISGQCHQLSPKRLPEKRANLAKTRKLVANPKILSQTVSP